MHYKVKKDDERILKKPKGKGSLNEPEYFDEAITLEGEYLGRPVPGPVPPKPHPPIPPIPPKPDPPKPEPTQVKFGDGLQVIDNVVSVKPSFHSRDFLLVSPEGVSINPVLLELRRLMKKLDIMEDRIVKLESDVNILKGKTTPESTVEIIVGKSKSFETDEKGLITIKTDDGIKTDDTGHIVVNGNDTLTVNEDGKIGVDYDDQTLGLVGEGDDKKLATVYNSFEMEIHEDEESN